MVKRKSFRQKGRVSRVTRRGRGRSHSKSKYPSGSTNRQLLVNYCKANDWTSYENLVAKMIKHKKCVMIFLHIWILIFILLAKTH